MDAVGPVGPSLDGSGTAGGRYGGLPAPHRAVALVAAAGVLALIGWLMLSTGRIAFPGTPPRAGLQLFLVRPPPPPPPPHPRPKRPPPPKRTAGGAPPRRPATPPPAPDPIIATPTPTPLALAPPAPLEAAPAALAGLDGAGGTGDGAGHGGGTGDGAGGPRTVRFARADWVRRPGRDVLARFWPRHAALPRRPVRILLSCRVDHALRPFGCVVVAGQWQDPAFGQAAIAMMGEALIRPVTRDGRRTDLPVLVPITFVPDR